MVLFFPYLLAAVKDFGIEPFPADDGSVIVDILLHQVDFHYRNAI
tara:strand:+ start:516 stop:650 length:135 start_codon:yes stop_codon:yes gene_type:complete